MSLNSFEFFLFFIPLLLLRLAMPGVGADKWLLLAASIAFYLTWSVPGVALILVTSLVSWLIGRQIVRTDDLPQRRKWLGLNLAVNLGILGVFKYANFFLENLSVLLNAVGGHVGRWHVDITLPPAISYFTFASMSYTLDLYSRKLRACPGLRDFTLFLSFFPKLLSGPIERAVTFLPQLQQRRKAALEDIEIGLTQFLVGAVKKMVLADQMAGNIGGIFTNAAQYDRFTLWQGMIGYAVQLYCDFSGYSDMAIGCARIMGFRLMENFQMPFSSITISEFWRRWHISLSFWFRDYVFLPMGVVLLHCRASAWPVWFQTRVLQPLEKATNGNFYPLLRNSVNFLVTMVLIGLWHGAGWGFVLFGLMHGLALSTHGIWTRWDPLKVWRNRGLVSQAGVLVSRALTLGVFVFSITLYRTPTVGAAFSYWREMFLSNAHATRLMSPYILPAVAIVLLAHLILNKDRNWAHELPGRPLPVRMAACTGLVLALALFGSTTTVPFIYFQF